MQEAAPSAATPAREAEQAVTGHSATPQAVAATHAGAEGAAGGHGGGLPQLDMSYWGGQIVWLLVLFALLYALIATVFAPRLRRVRDERDAAINGAIEEARRVRAEADAQAAAAQAEMTEARAKAQAAAADAKARAAAEAHARQAAQEAELNARLEAAETRIRASRDAAMGSVRQVAADTAGAIVERLTGRPAEPAEVEAALGPGRA